MPKRFGFFGIFWKLLRLWTALELWNPGSKVPKFQTFWRLARLWTSLELWNLGSKVPKF